MMADMWRARRVPRGSPRKPHELVGDCLLFKYSWKGIIFIVYLVLNHDHGCSYRMFLVIASLRCYNSDNLSPDEPSPSMK